jgi:hypothetical protein
VDHNVVAGGDAISAQTDVLISGGEFNRGAGGGSSAQIAEDASGKGIKGSGQRAHRQRDISSSMSPTTPSTVTATSPSTAARSRW